MTQDIWQGVLPADWGWWMSNMFLFIGSAALILYVVGEFHNKK